MGHKRRRPRARSAATAMTLAAVVLVGLLASPAGADKKTTKRTYPNRESFRLECLVLGGEFGSVIGGVTFCNWNKTSYTVCDSDWADPANCTYVHEFIVNRDSQRTSTGQQPQRSTTVGTSGSTAPGGGTTSSSGSTAGRAVMP